MLNVQLFVKYNSSNGPRPLSLCYVLAPAVISSCHPAATVEDARERGELQRMYYLLMAAVTSSGLSGALLKVPPAALEAAVLGLTRGAATHVDPNVRRTCLQVFSRLVGDWCGSPVAASNGSAAAATSSAAANDSEVVPGFRRYAMERLGEEACIVGLLRPTGAVIVAPGPGSANAGGFLDIRDAAVLNLLLDVAMALKLIYAKCGEEFPAHLVRGRHATGKKLPKEREAMRLRHRPKSSLEPCAPVLDVDRGFRRYFLLG